MFVDVFPVRLYVPAIKIPLSVKVKAIPYANLRTSHLIGGARPVARVYFFLGGGGVCA